jgi:hypothetical protein
MTVDVATVPPEQADFPSAGHLTDLNMRPVNVRDGLWDVRGIIPAVGE